MDEFQWLSSDNSSIKHSSSSTCFKENCPNIPEYLCRCSDKISLMCNIHIGDHIRPFPQNHILESILETVNLETQKALINFLREEKRNRNEIQFKILNKLATTFADIEDYIEKELDNIANEMKQIDNLIEVIANTKEVSKVSQNPMDSSLILKPDEAIDKFRLMIPDKTRYHKVIEYIYSHDKNIENVIENIILQKIDKIISGKLQNVIPNFDALNDKLYNLEESISSEIHLKEELIGKLDNLVIFSNELKMSDNVLKQEVEKTQKSLESQIAFISAEQKKSICNESRYLSMIDKLKVQINNISLQHVKFNEDEIEGLKAKLTSVGKQIKVLSSKFSEQTSSDESSEEECYLPKKHVVRSEAKHLKPRKTKKPDSSPLKELFVYGLCNDDLRIFLENCGKIESTRMLKSNSIDQDIAIVKFENLDGQINALKKNQTIYKGDQVHVSILSLKRTHDSFAYTIFASNLPLNLEKLDIEDYFSEYGEINQVNIIRDGHGNAAGRAWIEFNKIEDVEQIKKQNWISIEGRIIQVHYEANYMGK